MVINTTKLHNDIFAYNKLPMIDFLRSKQKASNYLDFRSLIENFCVMIVVHGCQEREDYIFCLLKQKN